jgi:hypothetical protein
MARGGHGLYLKFHSGPPCPTLLRPAGGPPLKRPYGRFMADPPAGQAACSSLLSLWTPYALALTVSLPDPHQRCAADVPSLCQLSDHEFYKRIIPTLTEFPWCQVSSMSRRTLNGW